MAIAIISQTTAFVSCLSVRSACASEVENEFLPHYFVYGSTPDPRLEEYDKVYRKYVKREYAPGEHARKLKIAREYMSARGHNSYFLVYDVSRDRHLMFFSCKISQAILNTNIGKVLRRDFGWRDLHFNWLSTAIISEDQELMQSVEKYMVSLGYNVENEKRRVIYDMQHKPEWARKHPNFCLDMKEVHKIMMPESKKDIR
ncbi:hypothetical protein V4P56_00420 [Bartonella sp. B35(2025)]